MPKLYTLITFIFLFVNPSFSQIQLKGIVKNNASNEPLVGVNIMVKGKQNGTITDRSEERRVGKEC